MPLISPPSKRVTLHARHHEGIALGHGLPAGSTPTTATTTVVPAASSASQGFIRMLEAYQAFGGCMRGDDLALMLADHCRGDFRTLARMLVAGEVFGFNWRNTLWVPMFQFDLRDLSARPALRPLLGELATLGSWQVASWLVQPNQRLHEHTPLSLLDSQLSDVLHAAHAERLQRAS
jgi:hypothetical protein